MNIDERIMFLVQSTESLHASLHEVHGSLHELRAVVQAHTKQLEIDAENIRRLASIAASHEARLEDLEGGEAS